MKSRFKTNVLAASLIVLQLPLSASVFAQNEALQISGRGVDVSQQPLPEYPRRAELSGIEGYAVVEFSVLPDGTVQHAELKESNNRLFSRSAINTVREWKFDSDALIAQNVPVTKTIRFNFIGE